MAISVAGGKGGTGKTTVATNLALSIESDVLLLDCPDKASTETGRERDHFCSSRLQGEKDNGFLLNCRISKMLNYALIAISKPGQSVFIRFGLGFI